MPSVKGWSHMKETVGIRGRAAHQRWKVQISYWRIVDVGWFGRAWGCKWIKFNHIDQSGKLVTWYNGPQIGTPLTLPSSLFFSDWILFTQIYLFFFKFYFVPFHTNLPFSNSISFLSGGSPVCPVTIWTWSKSRKYAKKRRRTRIHGGGGEGFIAPLVRTLVVRCCLLPINQHLPTLPPKHRYWIDNDHQHSTWRIQSFFELSQFCHLCLYSVCGGSKWF